MHNCAQYGSIIFKEIDCFLFFLKDLMPYRFTTQNQSDQQSMIEVANTSYSHEKDGEMDSPYYGVQWMCNEIHPPQRIVSIVYGICRNTEVDSWSITKRELRLHRHSGRSNRHTNWNQGRAYCVVSPNLTHNLKTSLPASWTSQQLLGALQNSRCCVLTSVFIKFWDFAIVKNARCLHLHPVRTSHSCMLQSQ